MPYDDQVNIEFTGDSTELQQASQKGQESFNAFIDVILDGFKRIYAEASHAADVFQKLGDAIAAPFQKIAKASGLLSATIVGTMGFAAESAQEYYAQSNVLRAVVEHTNHNLEEEAQILESVGESGEDVRRGMVDFNKVQEDAADLGRRLNITQKAIMVGFSNLASILPNNNKEWERFAKLAAFAAVHHPQYGDMVTQMRNLSAAIATGSTRMVRHIAGAINMHQAYKDYAAQIGKSVQSLNQMEKAQAALLAIEKQVGTIDENLIKNMNIQASVTNTLKRIWLSIGRIVYPIWQGIKKVIVAVLEPIATGLERAAKKFEDFRNSNEGFIGTLSKIMRPVGEVIGLIGSLLAKIVELATYILTLPLGILTSLFVAVGAAANVASVAITGFFGAIAIGIKAGGIISLIKNLEILSAKLKDLPASTNKGKAALEILKEVFLPRESLHAFEAVWKGGEQLLSSKSIDLSKAIKTEKTLTGIQRVGTSFNIVVRGILRWVAGLLSNWIELLNIIRKLPVAGKLLSPIIWAFRTAADWAMRCVTGIMEFTQGITRAADVFGKFTRNITAAGRAGEEVARAITGVTAEGAKIGRLVGASAKLGEWLAKLADLFPKLAAGAKLFNSGLLSDILLALHIGLNFLQMYRAYRVGRKELELQEAIQKKAANSMKNDMGAAVRTLTQDMASYKEEAGKAFELKGIKGLEGIREQHRKQLRSLINGGAILESPEVKRMVQVIANDTALIKSAQASITKNRYATAEMIKKDADVQRRAMEGQKSAADFVDQMSQALSRGDQEAYIKAKDQLEELAQTFGLHADDIQENAKEVGETIMKAIIRQDTPEWLTDMAQKFEELSDKVKSLSEKIMNMRFETEKFVLAFKLGDTAASDVDKLTASIEQSMNQLERAKAADARPEMLAQMTKGLIEQIDTLAEARQREFELTPGGRAMQLRIEAIPEGVMKQQAIRQLKQKFTQDVRSEFGSEGLMDEFLTFSDKAVQEQEDELVKAKELLDDVKDSAVAMAYIFKEAGGDVKDMNEALKHSKDLLDFIGKSMGNLTDEQRDQLNLVMKQVSSEDKLGKEYLSKRKYEEAVSNLPEVQEMTIEQVKQGFQKFGEVGEYMEEAKDEVIANIDTITQAHEEVAQKTQEGLSRARVMWDSVINMGFGETGAEIKKREQELAEERRAFEWEGKQTGGQIFGPPGIDKVPIMATRDEFMIRAPVSRQWMNALREFNITGNPMAFFRNYAKGFAQGGPIGYQAGGAVRDSGIDRLLAASNDALNMISSKLDSLTNISSQLAEMITRLDVVARRPIEVQIPDTKVAFDPLQVNLILDDQGRLVTRDELLELLPRPRTEGFSNA